MVISGATAWFVWWAMATGVAFLGARFSLRMALLWVALSAVTLHVTVRGEYLGHAAWAIPVGYIVLGSVWLWLWSRRLASQGREPQDTPEFLAGARLFAAGFLLAVIAFLGPSVRHAREAAHRTQCRGNLHQIGLALHNYHDMFGCFPPAVVTDSAGRPMHSWTVYLLPFLDETALYNAYNFAHAWDHAANTTVGRTCLAQLQCPSVREDPRNLTHYGMVVCPDSVCGVDQCGTIGSIRDGTSNTIIVAEMSRTACPWSQPAAVVDLTRGLNAPKGLPQGASSAHVGGVFCVFCDGQVRFLSEQMDITTLRALCTAAGNEAVDDEDF